MAVSPIKTKYESFSSAVGTFRTMHKRTMWKKSPYSRFIRKVRHRLGAVHYWERHPEMEHTKANPGNYAGVAREENREFFMKNSDDVLSSTGAELDILAEHFDVDLNLPTQDKQEKVYEAMAQKYIHGDKEWNKKEIARQKKHFIETIEKTHFVNLTCSILQLNESVVRTWIKTDPEFALAVRSAQVRFGERVGHSVLVQALNGDMAAAMYVLKEFKDSVKFIDPQVEEVSANDTSMVDNLTPEEQETLLHLTRKARQKAIENGEDVSAIEVDMSGQSLIGIPAIESAEEKFANIDEEIEETPEITRDETFIDEYNGD